MLVRMYIYIYIYTTIRNYRQCNEYCTLSLLGNSFNICRRHQPPNISLLIWLFIGEVHMSIHFPFVECIVVAVQTTPKHSHSSDYLHWRHFSQNLLKVAGCLPHSNVTELIPLQRCKRHCTGYDSRVKNIFHAPRCAVEGEVGDIYRKNEIYI